MTMKSRRLNRDDHTLIVNGFLKLKYGTCDYWTAKHTKEAAFVKKWVKKVKAAMFTPQQTRRMKALPKGWLPMINHIQLVAIPRGEKKSRAYFEFNPPMLCTHEDSCRAMDILTEARFSSIRAKLLEDMEKEMRFGDQFTSDRSQIRLCAAQFRSTKQLLADWPEAMQFLPEPEATTVTKALMIVPSVITAAMQPIN